MVILLIGMAIFFGIHALPWKPALRSTLIERFGPIPYKGVFALISGAGFTLMLIGYASAPREHLWDAPSWGPHLALSAVPVAMVLIAAAYIGSNIKRLTSHPMLWGIVLWSVAHLVNIGDAPSALLFGGFLVYALGDMTFANRRVPAPSRPKVALWRDGLSLIVGIGAAALFAQFHANLFGVAIPH